MKVRNTFIIFIVSGFWHGANWTFIVWGALNAIYFLPLLLTNNNRNNLEVVAYGKYLPSFRETLSILGTFGLTVLAWVFFRAENIGHALQYLSEIFSSSLFDFPDFPKYTSIRRGALVGLLSIFFLVVEWFGREGEYAIHGIGLKLKKHFRYAFYYMIIFLIFWFGGEEQEFIYFQF